VAVPALAVVLAYGYTQFGGLWGQVRLSTYPSDWYAAERVMGGSDNRGRVLIFPWHLYAVWSFSDGRIVANPAPSFFSGDVVVNPEAGFAQVPTQFSDPVVRSVAEILDGKDQTRLGARLASVGIHYVALLREVDYWNYRFFRREPVLRAIYKGPALILLENRRWRLPP
jgi:hypothetical protein